MYDTPFHLFHVQAHFYLAFLSSPAAAPALLLPHPGWESLSLSYFQQRAVQIWLAKGGTSIITWEPRGMYRVITLLPGGPWSLTPMTASSASASILRYAKTFKASDLLSFQQSMIFSVFPGLHLYACLPSPLPGWLVLVSWMGNLPSQHCKWQQNICLLQCFK